MRVSVRVSAPFFVSPKAAKLKELYHNVKRTRRAMFLRVTSVILARYPHRCCGRCLYLDNRKGAWRKALSDFR